jgi:hypothetical protein
VPELAGGASEIANTLILESKENSTVSEVGIIGPFEGSDVSEPPINVSVAGKPLYMGGTLHLPSDPGGPESTDTGRSLRSMSATVTHQTTPEGTSSRAATDAVVAKTTVVAVVVTVTVERPVGG